MPRFPSRRALVRGIARAAAALALVLVALLVVVQLRWQRTFDVPLPALHARTDSATIARGRYLAYGPAHCASCHVTPSDRARLRAGGQPPLTGGTEFKPPVGRWYAANLTPDRATGIGRWSDGQIARVLRGGVRHDGRVLFPAMEYQELADDDIVALLSFLRAQPPVRHAVPPRRVNVIGRAMLAFGFAPKAPSAAPPRTAPRGSDAAAGAYLANVVAGCDGCHTKRDLRTGKYVGPPYGGGTVFRERDAQGRPIVSPNLTPGAGPMATWTEAQFVARLRAGRAHPQSPMEWEAFQQMPEEDLRAIYRYLRSL